MANIISIPDSKDFLIMSHKRTAALYNKKPHNMAVFTLFAAAAKKLQKRRGSLCVCDLNAVQELATFWQNRNVAPTKQIPTILIMNKNQFPPDRYINKLNLVGSMGIYGQHVESV